MLTLVSILILCLLAMVTGQVGQTKYEDDWPVMVNLSDSDGIKLCVL